MPRRSARADFHDIRKYFHRLTPLAVLGESNSKKLLRFYISGVGSRIRLYVNQGRKPFAAFQRVTSINDIQLICRGYYFQVQASILIESTFTRILDEAPPL